MSLDFYLLGPTAVSPCPSTTVVYEGCFGDYHLVHTQTNTPKLFRANITHNLNSMFDRAGLYDILWRGDGLIAGDVLPRLEEGLKLMLSNRSTFEALAPSNGWGNYDGALRFLLDIIRACTQYPEATISCSR